MPVKLTSEASGRHIVRGANVFLVFTTIAFAAIVLFELISTEGLKVNGKRVVYDGFTILCIAVSMSLIITGIKLAMNFMHEDCDEEGLLDKCKEFYVIGCIGMLSFSILSFVLIGFYDYSLATNICIYFVCNITSIVLYYTFIREIERFCQLKHKKTHVAIVLIICAFLLFARYCRPSRPDPVLYLACTYLYVPCYVITLITIVSGNLKLMDQRRARNVRGSPSVGNITPSVPAVTKQTVGVKCNVIDETKPSAPIQQQSTDVECEICMVKCDGKVENRTPRLLVTCGHTMCQGCIKQMLASNNQHQITCPFCQQVTVVRDGNVENLPKNFAILKLFG